MSGDGEEEPIIGAWHGDRWRRERATVTRRWMSGGGEGGPIIGAWPGDR